jgi:hypothetical protein
LLELRKDFTACEQSRANAGVVNVSVTNPALPHELSAAKNLALSLKVVS